MFKFTLSSFLLIKSFILTKKKPLFQWILTRFRDDCFNLIIYKGNVFNSIFCDHAKKSWDIFKNPSVCNLALSSNLLFIPNTDVFIYQYLRCLLLLKLYFTDCLVFFIIINFRQFDVNMWQVQKLAIVNTVNWSGNLFYLRCNYF